MMKPYDAAREALDKACQELWRAQEYYVLPQISRQELESIRNLVIEASQRFKTFLNDIESSEV